MPAGNLKVHHDFTKNTVKYATEVKLENGVKLAVTYPWSNSSSKSFTAHIEKGDFKLEYDTGSKDLVFKAKRSLQPGTLFITQRVPNGKWAVVPSPKIELKTNVFSSDKFKDHSHFSYDYMTRLATISETLKYQGKHKFKVSLDNKPGLDTTSITLGSKLNMRFAKSVSLNYTKAAGPTLNYKTGLAPGYKLKASANPNRGLNATLIIKPDNLDLNSELVLDASVPFKGDLLRAARVAPKLAFKVNF